MPINSAAQRNAILLVLFICSCISSYAQVTFDAKALKEDFSIVKDLAIGMSPRLTPEDQIELEKVFHSRLQELDEQTLTTNEFGQFIRDSHFDTKFDEHASITLGEDIVASSLVPDTRFFPIPIRLIGDHLIVNSEESKIPYGSNIKSINGVTTDSILGLLLKDKSNTHLKKRKENQFSFSLLFEMGMSDTFRIMYTSSIKDSAILECKVDGLTFDDYSKLSGDRVYPLNKEQRANEFNTHFYEDSKSLYMQLNSFSWNHKRGTYKLFRDLFDETFDRIKSKGVENLIIDLRYNPGGSVRIPALLYSYIAEEAFTETIKLEMRDMTFPYHDCIIALNNKDVTRFRDVKRFTRSLKRGFEEIDGRSIKYLVDNTIREPRDNAFTGDVYLLVGGGSQSASVYFTSLFKAYDRGTIIGEQVGSSHHDVTAGKFVTYQLPNTKIKYRIPLMSIIYSDEIYQKVPEKKITSDTLWSEETEYDYFLKKEDLELLETLKLINSKMLTGSTALDE